MSPSHAALRRFILGPENMDPFLGRYPRRRSMARRSTPRLGIFPAAGDTSAAFLEVLGSSAVRLRPELTDAAQQLLDAASRAMVALVALDRVLEAEGDPARASVELAWAGRAQLTDLLRVSAERVESLTALADDPIELRAAQEELQALACVLRSHAAMVHEDLDRLLD